MDIDFGYGGSNGVNDTTPPIDVKPKDDITNLDDGKVTDPDKTSLDGEGNDPKPPVTDPDPEHIADNNLVAGSTIEVGDEIYTVDEKGNVVDKNGNIFKEAKDVNNWLKEFEAVDGDDKELSIDSIKNLVGIDITDSDDKPIEFENTPEGVKAYIDAVIESKREENYDTAINTLYQRYPILNDVLNYYIANGNSLEGFGEIPDRSNITIDSTNEAQQETIIRTAWKEQGRKGDVESYINYLKSSGTLYATAQEELAGLQEADKQYRDELEKQAEAAENERIEKLEKYWNGVKSAIDSRTIAGYQIPESFVVTRNGQKVTVTPNDFFNYLYRVDKDGKSAYQYDLEKTTPESRRDDEILRAYLTFVGGDYSTLVNMAINKQQVNNLKLKAKERNKPTVKINKVNTAANKGTNIDLGYN